MEHKLLTWDSEYFGFPVGQIEHNTITLPEIQEAENIIEKHGLKLTYFSSGKIISGDFLRTSTLKWKMVDRKIVYSKAVRPQNVNLSQVTSYNKLQGGYEELRQLVFQSGEFSRFSTDERINRDQFEKLYSLWLDNSINRLLAFDFLVYWDLDKPIGFVTVGEKNGCADIGLIAVNIQSRGQGIGRQLMLAAESLSQKYDRIQVVTQGANTLACRFYESLGYTMQSERFFYHIWK